MKYLGLIVLSIFLASCPTIPPGPPPLPGYDCLDQPRLSGPVTVENPIKDQYIVVLKDPVKIHTLMSMTGVTQVKTLRQGYAAKIARNALNNLLSDPNILYIQQDGVKRVTPIRVAEITNLWGLDRIDQRDLPLDSNYNPGLDGAGINVAIIDTGITNHPDFENRFQSECFTAHQNSCSDMNGHGTHVTGTIGGLKYGVAKKVKLFAVRVLDANGSGSDSDVIRGINWVTSKKLASPAENWVANMSLGGSSSPALDRAVCEGIIAGITFAIAAGNESQDANNSSPARVRQAITVGATDRADAQANFSNFGPLLDIYAPGVNIESTQPGNSTDIFSGTSMATPHVTGGAALYLSAHPGSSPQEVRDGLVNKSSKDKVKEISPDTLNNLLYVKEEN